jgi:hypothetical protein
VSAQREVAGSRERGGLCFVDVRGLRLLDAGGREWERGEESRRRDHADRDRRFRPGGDDEATPSEDRELRHDQHQERLHGEHEPVPGSEQGADSPELLGGADDAGRRGHAERDERHRREPPEQERPLVPEPATGRALNGEGDDAACPGRDGEQVHDFHKDPEPPRVCRGGVPCRRQRGESSDHW